MVTLTPNQTKGLQRLMKKIEVKQIGFDNGVIEGDVIIHLMDLQDQTLSFVVMANGFPRKAEQNGEPLTL